LEQGLVYAVPCLVFEVVEGVAVLIMLEDVLEIGEAIFALS
jgi:hypothetical protein